MKTKTVVIIAVICGAVILFTKAKEARRGIGDFFKNLLDKIGNLSRDIIDGIKNMWNKLFNKNDEKRLSSPLLQNGVGGNPMTSPSIFEKGNSVEVIGLKDSVTGNWVGIGYDE